MLQWVQHPLLLCQKDGLLTWTRIRVNIIISTSPHKPRSGNFPKGPTPLNHIDAPLSPSVSTYGNPLASPAFSTFHGKGPTSPMFPPHTPGYAESIMSMTSQTPTTMGFSGPPPSAGVDMYKVAPTNAVYFGPYLKYINMDLERGMWLGSIMLVADAPQPPTIHIHQSVDLSLIRDNSKPTLSSLIRGGYSIAMMSTYKWVRAPVINGPMRLLRTLVAHVTNF